MQISKLRLATLCTRRLTVQNLRVIRYFNDPFWLAYSRKQKTDEHAKKKKPIKTKQQKTTKQTNKKTKKALKYYFWLFLIINTK